MSENGSVELGKRLQNGDVIAGNLLSDLFAQNGDLEGAQRIYDTNQAYIEGWQNPIQALKDEFNPRVFNEEANRWIDSTTGQFASNPATDEAFLARARELRLID